MDTHTNCAGARYANGRRADRMSGGPCTPRAVVPPGACGGSARFNGSGLRFFFAIAAADPISAHFSHLRLACASPPAGRAPTAMALDKKYLVPASSLVSPEHQVPRSPPASVPLRSRVCCRDGSRNWAKRSRTGSAATSFCAQVLCTTTRRTMCVSCAADHLLC